MHAASHCRSALSFLTPPADPLPSSRLALGNESHKNKRVPAGEAERCASFRACRACRTGVTFFRSSDFSGRILRAESSHILCLLTNIPRSLQIQPRIPRAKLSFASRERVRRRVSAEFHVDGVSRGTLRNDSRTCPVVNGDRELVPLAREYVIVTRAHHYLIRCRVLRHSSP